MELKIVEESADKLVVIIEGVDHTVMNALVHCIQEQKGVLVAAYSIEHPLRPIPQLLIQTKGAKPKDALVQGIDALDKQLSAFTTSFAKAFK